MKKTGSISAAIIYARQDSSRLPNKIFSKISKYSILECLLNRSKYLNVDMIILATTDRKLDNGIEAEVNRFKRNNKINLNCFRGDHSNLIKRTQQAINFFNISKFCRINGDSPFFPVHEINSSFDMLNDEIKFVNNIRCRSFPYGIAIETFTSDFFANSLKNNEFIQKEHMTAHIYKKKKNNDEYILKNKKDLSKAKLVVDTSNDLEEINSKIFRINKKPWNIHYTKLL